MPEPSGDIHGYPKESSRVVAANQLNSIARQINGKETSTKDAIALAQALATLAVADAIERLADQVRGVR